MSEHQEQCAVIRWFDIQCKPHRLFSIPNGGQRHAAVAAKLKAEGVRAGVPDLFLPVSRHGFHGLFIELKAKGGKLQTNQADWLAHLTEQGYMAVVCVGADKAIQTIREYLQ